MAAPRVWCGLCLVSEVRIAYTDTPTRRRGRVYYFRRNGPVPNRFPPELLATAQAAVKKAFAANARTRVVAMVLDGTQRLRLARLKTKRHSARTAPSAMVLVRRARLLQARYRAQLARTPRGGHPFRRRRVAVDLPAAVAWYVPMVSDDAAALARFRAIAAAAGDVPEFVKTAMARWDPLALLWLEDPGAARELVAEFTANEEALPVPGTWPRLADEGARLTAAVTAKSAACAAQEQPLAAAAVPDHGDAPLWRYLPPAWETTRYQSAGWGAAPTDVPAASLARLFPDAPCIYAAQRMYGIARASVNTALEGAGITLPVPGPWPVATPAGTPWHVGKPVSYYTMRMLFGVVRVARTTGASRAQLMEARATLVGLYPRVFIWP